MQKPEYDYDALKQGLVAMETNIKALQHGIEQAEQQKAQACIAIKRADEQQKVIRAELSAQMERQAEFRGHVKRHERWRKTES